MLLGTGFGGFLKGVDRNRVVGGRGFNRFHAHIERILEGLVFRRGVFVLFPALFVLC